PPAYTGVVGSYRPREPQAGAEREAAPPPTVVPDPGNTGEGSGVDHLRGARRRRCRRDRDRDRLAGRIGGPRCRGGGSRLRRGGLAGGCRGGGARVGEGGWGVCRGAAVPT